VGDPVVYPNPYDISTGEPLIFENVVPGSLIQIYTLSGERVAAIQAPSIKVMWDGKNGMGRKVSPGIYYFVIHNQSTGQVKKGKLFVVGGNK
jgi:flagellar hook assembly protein FlgD